MIGSPASSMPVWYGFLTPVLRVLSDGQVWRKRNLHEAVFEHLGLTADERDEVLDSGQRRADNRIGWALNGLDRADLISKPARATFTITTAGRDELAAHPEGLDERTLKTLLAYRDRIPTAISTHDSTHNATSTDPADPLEQIESGVARLHDAVAAELLKRLRDQHPDFLEHSVLDRLVAMGYGSTERRATRIGGSGDGGFDDVINQDALGLDRIYLQAKRYDHDNTVQRPAVQAFVGARTASALPVVSSSPPADSPPAQRSTWTGSRTRA